ncbi:MAG: ASCH domain-containing protein [Clostridia bacterium]|nr:ASCH domain-containing protein [Clostridia bacterium]
MTVFSKAQPSDLPEILEIYRYARAEMARAGNPTQWKNDRPSEETLRADIAAGALLKAEDRGSLRGVFALYRGEDPTYARIFGGAWRVPPPYGVIHRIARAPGVTGFFAEALGVAAALAPALRIDTHKDNLPMLHLLGKHGFSYRGIICTDNGTERMAFDRPARPARTFEMNLDPEPFRSVASGEKTVEMRLYDERRRQIAVGDTVVFVNRENGARLAATVGDLLLFADFRELYAALPLSSLGYAPAEIAGASFRDMEMYYSPERQKECGVVGILLRR